MKILQINAVIDRGSTGVIARGIGNVAEELGHSMYYAVPGVSFDINVYQIGTFLDHKIHAFLCRLNGKQAYFSRQATEKLLCYIDQLEPDIIHLHNLHSNYVNLNVLLKSLSQKKIPIVLTMHDCWYFTGGCFHYTNIDCWRWQKNCGNCPKKLLDTPAYFCDKSSAILADRKRYLGDIENLEIVGVSDWIVNETKKSFLCKKSIRTIHNGIDLTIFCPRRSSFREKYNLEGKFVVLGFANKWLTSTNRAELKILKTLTDGHTQMIIAGCTDKQLHMIPPGMIGLGHIEGQIKMAELYSACDVFVNITREDTLPTVNLEAEACGTPVITYKNTGAAETVGINCGYIIETGNVETLIHSINEVRRKGKAFYSESCISFIKKNYEKKENYLKYINLYESIFSAR